MLGLSVRFGRANSVLLPDTVVYYRTIVRRSLPCVCECFLLLILLLKKLRVISFVLTLAHHKASSLGECNGEMTVGLVRPGSHITIFGQIFPRFSPFRPRTEIRRLSLGP